MSEETRIDKLAKYFNHPFFDIHGRYGWTFEEFVAKIDSGEFARLQEGIKTAYTKRPSRSEER